MAVRHSPLALPINQPDPVPPSTHDPEINSRLGPHGLPINFAPSDIAFLTGAGAPAQAGNVTAVVPLNRVHLTPLVLAMQERTFTPKGVGEATAVLTGAAAIAQAEELEGANATVYIDGAQALAESGSVAGAAVNPAERVVLIVFEGKTRVIEFGGEHRSIELAGKHRSITMTGERRDIQFTGKTRRIDLFVKQ